MTFALTLPKLKPFDTACCIFIARACPPMRSSPSAAASGFSRLRVGGAIWSRSASTMKIASRSPRKGYAMKSPRHVCPRRSRSAPLVGVIAATGFVLEESCRRSNSRSSRLTRFSSIRRYSPCGSSSPAIASAHGRNLSNSLCSMRPRFSVSMVAYFAGSAVVKPGKLAAAAAGCTTSAAGFMRNQVA